MTKKWNYGGAHDRYPIEEGETWSVDNGRGLLKVHDIYNPLPEFMKEADMVYVDPPWNLSNVNTFYTKADKRGEHKNTYNEFYQQLFKQIDVINPNVAYSEIGKQNVNKFIEEFESRFPYVQSWEITYYNTNPCYLIRGSKLGPTKFDFTGIDDEDTPRKAIPMENAKCVADLCMGRGLIAETAYENNIKFVGTELNKKRLAVTIEKIAKLGGSWKKI